MEFNLNTSLPIHFEITEEIEDSRFLKGQIWVCHTGKNLNNSYFSKESIENAIPSLANIPVLGFIETNNLNDTDFKGHEQRLVVDKDGVTIEYLGRSYGLVPENNNARFEIKEDDDGVEREYLVCDVLIWTKFSEATEIIERDGIKNHSMELDPSSIKGKFNQDKLFEFTDFKFEGLCLLGNDIKPAMKGSILELFSKPSIQNQFKEMITEFNQFYLQYNQSTKTDQNKQKGGDNVDEKLELFTKFPTLKEEDVAALKEKIEQYSLEDLEAKLNELAESQDRFSTAGQLRQEINKVLSQFTYKTEWGGELRSYWYIDHDENRVYAEDNQNGHVPVGMNYSVDGDFVNIDVDSKKRVKFVPQDMEGDEMSTSFVSTDRKEFEVEQAKVSTKKEVEKQFESIQEELDEIKPKFDTLKTERDRLQEKVDEFSAKDTEREIGKLNQKIEDLSAYKDAREKQDKLDVIEKFTQLSDEDKKPFVDNIDRYTKEELEDKLFAEVGRKGISNFSKSNKNEHLTFSLNNYKSNSPTEPAWTELVEQYKSKKQI